MTDFVANFRLEQNNIDADFELENVQFDAVFQINPAGTNWGSITGELEEQTDLQEALDAKANVDYVDSIVSGLNTEINKKVETITGSDLIDVQRTDNAVTVTSKTFVFEQGFASSEWVINHNLDKYPSITLVDTAGTIFIGQVVYNDFDNCTVKINGATKGKAYLN